MTVTHSLTLIAAIADVPAANAYFEGLGWGDTLVVPLSPTGALPATHLAAHDFRTVGVVATLQAAQASSDPALDAIDNLFIYAVESGTAMFAQAIQSPEISGALGTTLVQCSTDVDP